MLTKYFLRCSMIEFFTKSGLADQTFLFDLLSVNQNDICNILCALNWICAWRNKKKQMYEVHSTLFITFFNELRR